MLIIYKFIYLVVKSLNKLEKQKNILREEEGRGLRKWNSVRLGNDPSSQLINKVPVFKEVTFIERKEAKRMNLKLEAWFPWLIRQKAAPRSWHMVKSVQLDF